MLTTEEHDWLLDLWDLFKEHEAITVPQQNLYRDLEIALGLVRAAKDGKARREAIDRCLRVRKDKQTAEALCPCSYHSTLRRNLELRPVEHHKGCGGSVVIRDEMWTCTACGLAPVAVSETE